jgi:hypothetical protein
MNGQAGVPDLLDVLFVRLCGIGGGFAAGLVVNLRHGGSLLELLGFAGGFVCDSLLAGKIFGVDRWWAWPIPRSPKNRQGNDRSSGRPPS